MIKHSSEDWKQKHWVMIPRSRNTYPTKQIYDQLPTTEHPLGRWHYEDDLSHPPTTERLTPTFLEDNGDGSVTGWGYTIWGAVGHTGTLTVENQRLVEEIVTKKDKHDLAQHILTLESASRKGDLMAEILRSTKRAVERDGELHDFSRRG